jgi:hypothetical protein
VHIARREGGADRMLHEILIVEKWDLARDNMFFRG